MKSERRHELQTNTLADWTGRQIDAIKPHVGLIATLALAAVAVLVVWMYFLQWNSSETTVAWQDFYKAADKADPASLIEMAKEHAEEPASTWAILLAADVQLAQGAGSAFTDRKEAEKQLKQAVQSYEAVLKDAREPVLRRRALYGLAEAHESLYAVTADKDDLNDAIKNYEQVAKQWSDTVLGRSAAKKKDTLAAKSAQEFLVWFSKQEPVQTGTEGEMGAESAAPTSPFDLSTLPGASDLLLPEEEPTPPATETKTPAESDAPPAAAEKPNASEAIPPTQPAKATPDAANPDQANPPQASPEEGEKSTDPNAESTTSPQP